MKRLMIYFIFICLIIVLMLPVTVRSNAEEAKGTTGTLVEWYSLFEKYIGNPGRSLTLPTGVSVEIIYPKGTKEEDAGTTRPLAVHERDTSSKIPLRLFEYKDDELVLVWENEWIEFLLDSTNDEKKIEA
jgi:hypothetical protein